MIEKIKQNKLAPQTGITKFNTVDLAYQLFQEDNGLDDDNKIADTIILFIAGHETTGRKDK
jgi:cytochrome P450